MGGGAFACVGGSLHAPRGLPRQSARRAHAATSGASCGRWSALLQPHATKPIRLGIGVARRSVSVADGAASPAESRRDKGALTPRSGCLDILILQTDSLDEPMLARLRRAFPDGELAIVPGIEDALHVLRDASPRLVIADLSSPEHAGTRLLSKIHESRPYVSFIVMCGAAAPELGPSADPDRITLLRKPFSFEALQRAIHRSIERSEFVGQVGGISLIDLLQVMNLGRRSVAISVQRGSRRGWIHLQNGEVIHATLNDSEGMTALRELLTWTEGRFGTEPGRPVDERTIHEPLNAVLLDAMREIDEEDPSTEPDLSSALPAPEAAALGAEASADRAALAAPADPSVAPVASFDRGARAQSDTAATERAQSAGRRQLRAILERIPGATGVATLSLGAAPRVVRAEPADILDDTVWQHAAGAVAQIFESAALAALDRALAGERPSPGFRVREAIVICLGRIHFLQPHAEDAAVADFVLARGDANLGAVLSRARLALAGGDSR